MTPVMVFKWNVVEDQKVTAETHVEDLEDN
jgi:hypothetical protein